MDTKQQTTKRHISFRLEPETIDQIKELKSLFGAKSEGAMIEKIVSTFFASRKSYLEADMQEKLKRVEEGH